MFTLNSSPEVHKLLLKEMQNVIKVFTANRLKILMFCSVLTPTFWDGETKGFWGNYELIVFTAEISLSQTGDHKKTPVPVTKPLRPDSRSPPAQARRSCQGTASLLSCCRQPPGQGSTAPHPGKRPYNQLYQLCPWRFPPLGFHGKFTVESFSVSVI